MYQALNIDGIFREDSDFVIDRTIYDSPVNTGEESIIPRYNYLPLPDLPPALNDPIMVNPEPFTSMPHLTPTPEPVATSLASTTTPVIPIAATVKPIGNGGYFSSLVSPAKTSAPSVQKKPSIIKNIKNKPFIIAGAVLLLIVIVYLVSKK
jgi:hypothetical protein